MEVRHEKPAFRRVFRLLSLASVYSGLPPSFHVTCTK